MEFGAPATTHECLHSSHFREEGLVCTFERNESRGFWQRAPSLPTSWCPQDDTFHMFWRSAATQPNGSSAGCTAFQTHDCMHCSHCLYYPVQSYKLPDEWIFRASAVQMWFVLQFVFSWVCFEEQGLILDIEPGSEILVRLLYLIDFHLIFIQGPIRSDPIRSDCISCSILCVKSHRCSLQSNLCNQARQNEVDHANVPLVGHVLHHTLDKHRRMYPNVSFWRLKYVLICFVNSNVGCFRY